MATSAISPSRANPFRASREDGIVVNIFVISGFVAETVERQRFVFDLLAGKAITAADRPKGFHGDKQLIPANHVYGVRNGYVVGCGF